MDEKRITVLGLGNILLADEGFGVKVVLKMQRHYRFPENVSLVDGNVLGLNLLGTVSDADHLIVVDAVKNKGEPGTIHRLEGDQIPQRIRAKNSLHQVDFLETLTLCEALGNVPKTVIIGVEPKDIQSVQDKLTPEIKAQMDPVIDLVLAELSRLGVSYIKGVVNDVPCHPFQDCED
jgi:hydrogenase maturation protease